MSYYVLLIEAIRPKMFSLFEIYPTNRLTYLLNNITICKRVLLCRNIFSKKPLDSTNTYFVKSKQVIYLLVIGTLEIKRSGAVLC